MITPQQCRAARALVDVEQARLAELAQVSRNTIVDFEKSRRTPNRNNLTAIQRALEDAGVIFLDEDDEGPGVRMRKRTGAA